MPGPDSAAGPRPLDTPRMHRALALAEGSIGLTEPNPRVGCVIGLADGTVLGEGATQQAGGAHAEVMALRDAQSRGHRTEGATAWVTLEPCSHHGRTPPCCDALVAAGIRRVVVGALDPFPQVNGAGIARLRAAGIAVDLAEPELQQACRDINIGFFSRHERGRPWVRLKVAVSMDGRTALADGRSRWITGAEARRDGHVWRRRASAVLTGVGTVIADDPRLDVRLVTTASQPLRIVLDSHWRTPAAARLLAPPGPALVVGVDEPGPAAQALADRGAELLRLRAGSSGVDLQALWQALAARGVNEVHVEAGPGVNGALVAAGWVDECLVYLAPKLLGTGRGLAQLPETWGPHALEAASEWQWFECQAVGDDLRLRARRRPGQGATGRATTTVP
jgi:diaminohydroxyphosphoribosylaminopyrimidine deaminase / 5-amino-6-(5-phosphoribosylamino)uracil reductase